MNPENLKPAIQAKLEAIERDFGAVFHLMKQIERSDKIHNNNAELILCFEIFTEYKNKLNGN